MNQRYTDDTKSVAGDILAILNIWKFDSGTCLASISRSASFLEGARVTHSRRQLFAMRGGHRVYHRDANGRVVAERTTMRFQQVDMA